MSPAERWGSFSACNSEKSSEGHTPACGIPPLNGGKKLQPRSTPLPEHSGPFQLSSPKTPPRPWAALSASSWQKYYRTNNFFRYALLLCLSSMCDSVGRGRPLESKDTGPHFVQALICYIHFMLSAVIILFFWFTITKNLNQKVVGALWRRLPWFEFYNNAGLWRQCYWWRTNTFLKAFYVWFCRLSTNNLRKVKCLCWIGVHLQTLTRTSK